MVMSLNSETSDKVLSPAEIRNILGMDNSQISELCKQAEILPRTNDRGYTYFTGEDAEKLKSYYEKTVSAKKYMSVPRSSSSDSAAVTKLVSALDDMEKNIREHLTSLLDEKLDGMDDVVLELIRVKTENETLRYKINELNKENYRLKKEVNSFKKIPFGFYAKKDGGSIF